MAVTFNCNNYLGEPIIIQTKWKDELSDIVKTQGDRHELASRILEFYSQELAIPQPTELDRVARLMIVEMQAGYLWKGWSRLVEAKQKDGTIQLTLVNDDAPRHCVNPTRSEPVASRSTLHLPVEDDVDFIV